MIRIFLCIFVFGLCLYTYIDKQNKITKLRLEIPALTNQLQAIEQENMQLKFQIDQFESPTHLLELAKRPEYRHLKHPLQDEVISLRALRR